MTQSVSVPRRILEDHQESSHFDGTRKGKRKWLRISNEMLPTFLLLLFCFVSFCCFGKGKKRKEENVCVCVCVCVSVREREREIMKEKLLFIIIPVWIWLRIGRRCSKWPMAVSHKSSFFSSFLILLSFVGGFCFNVLYLFICLIGDSFGRFFSLDRYGNTLALHIVAISPVIVELRLIARLVS